MALIIKRVEGRRGRRQSERDVDRLGRYIRNCRPGDVLEKIAPGDDGSVGMEGAETLEEQLILMKNLMRENTRPIRPVVHYIVSWEETDPRPTPAQVQAVAATLMDAVGLRGCMAIWSAHENTSHFHIHLAACRLDPETAKQRRMPYDRLAAMRAKAACDAALQLGSNARDVFKVKDAGQVVLKDGRFVAANEDIASDTERLRREEPPLPQGAKDAEHRDGVASAITFARKTLWPKLQKAESWAEAHEALAEAGCRMEICGGGMLVWVGTYRVKASQLARGECSRRALEARWGPYETAPSGLRMGPAPALGGAPKKKQKKRKTKEPEASPSPSSSPAAEALAVQAVLPVPGMPRALLAPWREYQAWLATEAEKRRLQAERQRTERKAATAAARAEARQAASRIAVLARKEGRLLRHGALEALRKAFYMRACRAAEARRPTAPAQPLPGFADWLESVKGRPDMAAIWRRRGGAPAPVEGAGARLLAAALARAQTRTRTARNVWLAAGRRTGTAWPEAGARMEEAELRWKVASVPVPVPAPAEAVLEPEDGAGLRPC